MQNPIDMLIGPPLRHPQRPLPGEAPGSRKPQASLVTVGAGVATVAVTAWAIQAFLRRPRGKPVD